jgi:predicted PurR-regulated permease PerM
MTETEAQRSERTTQPESFIQRAIFDVGIFLLVVTAIIVFWYLIDVMMYIFAGILFAIFLRIPTDWLVDHTSLSDKVALLISGIVIVGLLVLTGWLILPQVIAQFNQFGQLIPQAINELINGLRSLSERRGLLGAIPEPSEIMPDGGRITGRLTSLFSDVTGTVIRVLIMLFVGIYLALQPQLYARGVVTLVPSDYRDRAHEILCAIYRSLKWWLIGRLFAMVALGILVGIGLAILGIPLTLTLAVLAGVFSFVPTIGAILAVVPAALVALTQSPSSVLWVLIIYQAAQLIETYFLTPMVQQYAVMLPAALALMLQLLLLAIAGPLGVALAFPLALVGMILIQTIYVEDMLGDDVRVPGMSDGSEDRKLGV